MPYIPLCWEQSYRPRHAPLVSQGSLDSSRIPAFSFLAPFRRSSSAYSISDEDLSVLSEHCVGGRYKNPHLHRLFPQSLSLFETHSYNPPEQTLWRRILVSSTRTFMSRVLTTSLCRLHSHVEQLPAEHRRSSSAQLGVQSVRAWTSSDPLRSSETCVSCSPPS